MTESQSASFSNSWNLFWSDERACLAYGCDPSDKAQMYYCLGELAFLLCKDSAMSVDLAEAYPKMDDLRKAAFLDSCPIELLVQMRSHLVSPVEMIRDTRYQASILRALLHLVRSDISTAFSAALESDNDLVKGRVADEMVKIKQQVEDALQQIGKFCILDKL